MGTQKAVNLDKKEVLCVGDLHGCFNELMELLDRSGYKQGEMSVVLLGDLIDRGPDVAKVVQWARNNADVSCILGNHEESLLNYRKTLRQVAAGDDSVKTRDLTYDQKKSWDALTQDDLDWFESLPLSIRLADDLVCVHGGLEPARTYEEQANDPVILRIRSVDSKTGLSPQGKEKGWGGTGDTYWARLWKGPENVLYGHETHSHYTPHLEGPRDKQGNVCGPWTLGLDTGCSMGGYLTGYLVNRNAIVQVRSHQEYSRWQRDLAIYDARTDKLYGEQKTVWRSSDGPGVPDWYEEEQRQKAQEKAHKKEQYNLRLLKNSKEDRTAKIAAAAQSGVFQNFKEWKAAKDAGKPSVLIRKK